MHQTALAALLAATLCAAASGAAAASVPDSITDVRLSGSAAGRLEVQDSTGQWWEALKLCVPASADSSGTSGSRQLAEVESALANVACRQLGFPGGRPLAACTPNIQAPPEGPALSALLICNGNETSVDQCDLVESDCAQGEAPDGAEDLFPQPEVERTTVAIVCAGGVNLSGQLRLAGGPSLTEGRVEAELSTGEWTALCQAGAGAAATAEVVCRQLGLGGPAALRLGMYAVDDGAATLGLAEVLQCAGSEAGLGDCFLAPEATDACTQAGTLGVACSGAQTVQGFRLSGGASSAEGLLEVRLAGSDGSWGGVCALQQLAAVAAMAAADSSAAFDAHLAMAEAQNAAAEVACGALNLTGGVARVGAGFYTADATRLPAALIDGLACSGSEDGLSACGFSRARACPEGQRLGVSCGGAQTIAGLRLVDGPTPREGRLEVQLAGRWGTVSALGTTPFEAAAVVCRQLGWSTYGVQAQAVSFYGDGELPLLLWGIICDGSEATLSDCLLTHAPAGAGPATEAFSVSCAGERAVVG